MNPSTKTPKNPRLDDLSGRTFGRLTVSHHAGRRGNISLWHCICSCGQRKDVPRTKLIDGSSKSCGCLRIEMGHAKNRTHGKTKTPEYRTWLHMKNRCYNANVPEYAYYGARGITICERWLNSFVDFLADIGERPSDTHSIDRIDNNGNYEPSNCRWASKQEQAANRRYCLKNR